MADILQDFPVAAARQRVFEAVSTPAELDAWWTKRSAGAPREGVEYELWFGAEYDWRAVVSRCVPGGVFELRLTVADDDWLGTSLRFELEDRGGKTLVRFAHTGWPAANEHYRISCHCWAMYLRLLRRYVEHGERVAYEERLDV